MWIQVSDFTLENNLITLITRTLAGLLKCLYRYFCQNVDRADVPLLTSSSDTSQIKLENT